MDLAERVSGDTSVAHALAHCLAIEDALGIELPDEAHRLRALLVELERLYNHAADLGALANDVGFGLAHAHAQRMRDGGVAADPFGQVHSGVGRPALEQLFQPAVHEP
ncbi:hypothetical protein [Mycobacterium scrofulaceum]|uniref:hypothetical protein n=1 Tax=Mycobacterium scrofulaceum TaxID=1783 RepID=UPI003B02662F